MNTYQTLRMGAAFAVTSCLLWLPAGCTADIDDVDSVSQRQEGGPGPSDETCEIDIDPQDHPAEYDEPDQGDPPTFPNANGIRFESCNAPRCAAFELAADALLANWALFESNLVVEGISLPVNCLRRRLATNGRLRCAPTPNDHCPINRAGWTSPGSTRSRVCTGHLTTMETHNSTPSQLAVCQGTLMMHEFSHGCVATESRAESVDNAALATLNTLLGEARVETTHCRLD